MLKRIISALILTSIALTSLCACSDNKSTDTDANTSALTEEITNADTGSDTSSLVEIIALCKDIYEAGISAEDFPEANVYSTEDNQMDALSFCSYFGFEPVIDEETIDFAYPDEHERIESYTLRKPISTYEYASIDVIKVKSVDDLDTLKSLCEKRISVVKANYQKNANYDTDGSKKKLVDGITYKIYGTFGVVVCANDSANVFAKIDEKIK